MVKRMTKQPVYVDIKQEMQDWQNARFGRQVRSANVNALTKLQDQSNSAVDYIIEKGNEIDQTRQDANTILQSASDAVDHANSITAEYKQYADTKLSQTEAQRQLAENAKQGADDAATLAESWAVGGTETRPGENTNSSKYYCDQSGTYAHTPKMMRIGRRSIRGLWHRVFTLILRHRQHTLKPEQAWILSW